MSLCNFNEIKQKITDLNINVSDNYYDHKNYLKFPITHLNYSTAGMENYNRIIQFMKDSLKLNENQQLLTKSGGVCTYRDGFVVKRSKSTGWELIFKYGPLCFRVFFGPFNIDSGKTEIGGRYAFLELNKEFKKDGIDLMNYCVTNGLDIKKTIPSPLIMCGAKLQPDKIYQHVHHLDFHSAYGSGISDYYPELKPTYDRLYAKRLESEKQKKRIKSLFTNSTGYFQSKFCRINKTDYCLAPLAKAAITWTRNVVSNMSTELVKNGYTPLLFNTDGVWYVKLNAKDEPIESQPFVNSVCGKTLGTYDNDHVDCTFRVKSKGCYEYIENGEYKPVIRGVPKSITKDWKWGDIYTHSKIKTYVEENNYLKENYYEII